MAKMKMPKHAKAEKPHLRMRKIKPAAPSAFPTAPMAFPPDSGQASGASQTMPGQDPSQAMAAPPTSGSPADGMTGQ